MGVKSVVIIPTFNEKHNIKGLVEQILYLRLNLAILIIDDNSPDGTGQIIEELVREHGEISAIHRKVKLGIGSALAYGFREALDKGYDLIFTMDADFSHNPQYLPEFMKKISDHDVVIGSRYTKGGAIINWRTHRRLLSRSANLIANNLLDLKVNDCTSGFRCYKRHVLKSVDFSNIYSDGYSFLIEILFRCKKSNYSIRELPISFAQRRNGISKISRNEIIKAVITLARLKTKEILFRGNGFGS